MKTMTKTLLGTGIAIGVVLVAGAAVVQSGAYNVAADVPHSGPVYGLLETTRQRSIAIRARRLQVPPGMNEPERIRQGAGNYAAMCVGCHLAPGMGDTELSKGLYPAPPNLTREMVDVAEAFWVIKHGIKASGMPAWGASMDDAYIWNMAAFLQELPKLDKAAYEALVSSSDGHSHGGGETGGHSHGENAGDDHHGDSGRSVDDHHNSGAAHAHGDAGKQADSTDAPVAGESHIHADGKTHVHAPKTLPASEPEPADEAPQPPDSSSTEGAVSEHADDGHDHQH